ncbi:hypothetical protein [Actinokineospora enzanensis]|uniref:hypothetical protein n=1 Tax=Actinokineospora enzanensis TaxID=155975 RepID=UPI000376CCE7|nr:hypothetical protein [Actinokineospora enzanensis]
MTLLWITGSVLVLALVGWRLRRASSLVDRILVEERAGALRDVVLEAAESGENGVEQPAPRVDVPVNIVARWPHPPRQALARRRTEDRLAG